MEKILVIDDEESVGYSFRRLFREPNYYLSVALTAQNGLKMFNEDSFDLVILDMRLPDASGLEVLEKIKKLDSKSVVLMITAFSTTETAIEATKRGAYDYILKPFEVPQIKEIVQEALKYSRLLRTEVILEPAGLEKIDGNQIIGVSPVMQEVYKLIGKVASSDVNVLLLGESGTGKELVARAIYQHGNRYQKPFLAVNCAAIPETLLESELFGYEKGAFTGAIRKKIGKFEQANSGVIFLDEIGDMTLATQAKVLRVLQEGRFERVGGEQSLSVDVQVVAATNKNLEKKIREGLFREDLYYRLKVITITLPPLRLRRQDIPKLLDYFLEKYSISLRKDRLNLSPETLNILSNYDWPGNIRELENVVKRAIVLSKGNIITEKTLIDEIEKVGEEFQPEESHLSVTTTVSDKNIQRYSGSLYSVVMDETEKQLILQVLQKTGGNQVQACKILGVSRMMLRDRIEKYAIKVETTVKRNS